MKILQINAVYRQLSTGRSAQEWDEAFRSKGHEVVTAFSVGTVEDPQKEYLMGNKLGQKLHAFLSRLTGLQGYFSSHSTKMLLAFMDEFKPEIVVLRNLHANYIHLQMLLNYLAKKDIPTVAVLHDCWFYTGKCCHYTMMGCYRWQEACGNCPAKKKYNISWFFDRTPKMLADKKKWFSAIPRLGVVAVSDWILGEAKKAPVFSNAVAMKRIYNWIDMDKFVPKDTTVLRQELGLGDKKVILCLAAAWDRHKGLNEVVKIASMLEPQEQMILVGGILENVEIPSNVIYIPRTDSIDRLAELYSLADVLLQPSPEESFGKVSAEALCCGTPVVCFKSTANPELVGPGCGAVVPVGDLEGMLQQARRIYAQGKEQYEQRCRAFASEHFDMQKNIMQYMEFIHELMAVKDEEGGK